MQLLILHLRIKYAVCGVDHNCLHVQACLLVLVPLHLASSVQAVCCRLRCTQAVQHRPAAGPDAQPTSAIWAGCLARDMDRVLATPLLLQCLWGAVLLEAGQ